jgi:hypothetical protein
MVFRFAFHDISNSYPLTFSLYPLPFNLYPSLRANRYGPA